MPLICLMVAKDLVGLMSELGYVLVFIVWHGGLNSSDMAEKIMAVYPSKTVCVEVQQMLESDDQITIKTPCVTGRAALAVLAREAESTLL